MLLTRLLQEGEFEMVEPLTEPSAPSPPKSKEQLKQRQPKVHPNKLTSPPSPTADADFMLQGTLNKIGHFLSLDVKVVDLKRQQSMRGEFVEGENLDDIVRMVENLAKKLAKTLAPLQTDSFAKEMGKPFPAVSKETRKPGPPTLPLEKEPERREEPIVARKSPTPPLTLSLEKKRYEPIWQSEKIPSEIRGIALGNLKHRGSKDLIVLSRQSLMVYEIKENGLRFQREFRGNPQDLFLRVDVSDAERGEGYLLFLTNWSRNQVRSLILHATSKGIQRLGQDLGWFFRIVELPGLGARLIGQKFDPTVTFGGAVTLMVNKNGRFTEGDHVRLPGSANIYNFNFIENEDKIGIIVQGEDGLLRLYSSEGRLAWASKESYPGSMQYVLTGKSPIVGRSLVRKNNGGISELFLYHNRGTFLRASTDKGLRSSGVLGLSWDGDKISPRWETTGLESEISDFQVGDIDPESGDEMIVASVLKPEKGSKKPSSLLTVYKLP
jgi:hypothetical protein